MLRTVSKVWGGYKLGLREPSGRSAQGELQIRLITSLKCDKSHTALRTEKDTM